MASQNKIIEMIASIKTIYPYYAKETDVQMLVKTWTVLLKKYPDEAVEVAFFKCLQTCKMPPTPADVIEQLTAMQETNGQTDEELWSIFTKALRDVGVQVYRIKYPMVGEKPPREQITDIWEGLPDRVKQYIGSRNEIMRMSQNYTDEELKFEKTRFFKTMPTIKKREEYTELKMLLSGESKLMLEQGN